MKTLYYAPILLLAVLVSAGDQGIGGVLEIDGTIDLLSGLSEYTYSGRIQ